MVSTTPVEPKPAATIILLRDGNDGPEVLMLEKAAGSHFAAGALVFPGGKVSEEDAEYLASIVGAPENELALLKLSAVREMFEECGILLAHHKGTNDLLEKTDLGVKTEGEEATPFYDYCRSLSCQPATDTLVHFANWITPPTRSKRFDVHFFVAPAPALQHDTGVDGWEIVHAAWRRPKDLLEEAEQGKIVLVLATLMNLKKLAMASTVDEILGNARHDTIIPIHPEWIETKDGNFARIPEEAGYGETLIPTNQFRKA